MLAKTYRPGRYVAFEIHDPKRRVVSAAPFRDRVVHHALCAVVEPLFERGFIGDSFANRKGKGTHRAVARYEQFRDRRDRWRVEPSLGLKSNNESQRGSPTRRSRTPSACATPSSVAGFSTLRRSLAGRLPQAGFARRFVEQQSAEPHAPPTATTTSVSALPVRAHAGAAVSKDAAGVPGRVHVRP